MSDTRAVEMERQYTRDGGVFDYGPDLSRLVVRVIRTLAQGTPVSAEQVDRIIHDVGIRHDEADRLLRQVTERDADDSIVGIFGLSLNATPHRFSVDGRQLWTWCAGNTLYLPAILRQTATVESTSPVSGETVRLTVSPQRVEQVAPAGAVMSTVIVELDRADTTSVEAIWGRYCHHIYFFPSRGEAEQWAAGRDDIEILSVQESFDVKRMMASRFLSYQ